MALLFGDLFDLGAVDLFDLGGGANVFTLGVAPPEQVRGCVHLEIAPRWEATLEIAPRYEVTLELEVC